MTIPRTIVRASVRTGLVAVALTVLAGGVWHGVASAQASRPPQSTTPPVTAGVPVARDFVGTRTSYADLVKAVAPSVVTIRTESTAQVSPASMPQDEFFRRFFGDEQRGQRQMEPFRQRGL